MTGAAAGPWTRTPLRPWPACAGKCPLRSVTTLISEMMRRRLTLLDVILKAPTVYRFLHQQELMGKQVTPPVDRRRFEVELPNDIWQSDAMHGPMFLVGDKRRKIYLFAFIDDMSRA
ncbi:hypothetical protein DFAR_2770040 [Desulfarculales bacterium]